MLSSVSRPPSGLLTGFASGGTMEQNTRVWIAALRSGHDRRVLIGREFRLGRRVARQKYRIRSQKITHPRHGPIVPWGL